MATATTLVAHAWRCLHHGSRQLRPRTGSAAPTATATAGRMLAMVSLPTRLRWLDTDNDGYEDSAGCLPLRSASQHLDSDGDGFGDNSFGSNADRIPNG